MDPLIVVFGLGVGVLVGLTGIGGGSLMTPLLLIFIGTQPHVAVGTDIAYGALTKTVGGYQHLRNRTVDLGVSTWLAVGSVPSAIGGVIVVEALPSPPDEALLWGVAGALAFTAVVTLARALFVRDVRARERESVPLTRRAKAPRSGSDSCSASSSGDVGRERRADRARADPPLPAHPAPRGRHGRLPRRRPALGGRARARDRRQRRLRPDGHHPRRLDPGRRTRRAAGAGGAGRGSPARARMHDAGRGA